MIEIKFRPLIKWPTNLEQTILGIDFDLREFTKAHKLPFISHQDDLGDYEATIFYLESIGPVMIIRRATSTVDISINVDASVDVKDAIDKVTQAMSLDQKQILWRQTEDSTW
ncbi:hypothetical protein [Agarilytica rhodophyticola]|uniref:hypothetical protein n=1 Tax=Agarilytica rhodophyticola TaxID=1737490 RepID=UPI000B341F96|nr:hypothetical protein [Agarilytica rhodophyticola]